MSEHPDRGLTPQPYLSVVVTTRNDDHGGDPLKRLQAFVNCFDAQCHRFGLDAEVIVVEWNPPPDRPRVSSLLRVPVPARCLYRFIDVPAELHQQLQFSDVLPLFQMIAKNVGIRRARGRFVLATNIDIIFSNELIERIAARQLEPGRLYRVDRHDIQPDFPVDAPLEQQMEYGASHQLRVHAPVGHESCRSTRPAGAPVGRHRGRDRCQTGSRLARPRKRDSGTRLSMGQRGRRAAGRSGRRRDRRRGGASISTSNRTPTPPTPGSISRPATARRPLSARASLDG